MSLKNSIFVKLRKWVWQVSVNVGCELRIKIACRARATVVQIGGALALVFRGQVSTAVAAPYCNSAAAISRLGEKKLS